MALKIRLPRDPFNPLVQNGDWLTDKQTDSRIITSFHFRVAHHSANHFTKHCSPPRAQAPHHTQHRAGGGAKKIFDDKNYMKASQGDTPSRSLNSSNLHLNLHLCFAYGNIRLIGKTNICSLKSSFCCWHNFSFLWVFILCFPANLPQVGLQQPGLLVGRLLLPPRPGDQDHLPQEGQEGHQLLDLYDFNTRVSGSKRFPKIFVSYKANIFKYGAELHKSAQNFSSKPKVVAKCELSCTYFLLVCLILVKLSCLFHTY